MRTLPLLLLAACTGADPDPTDTLPPNPHGLDDVLRVNHLQLRATHNSYHQRPDQPIDDSHDYTMPTLTDQVDRDGVRGFELDLHWQPDDEVFHVLHLPFLDGETSCLLFTDCLQELRDWSLDHPWHAPLVIWLEPKDDLDGLATGYGLIAGRWDALEAEILSVWPRSALLTPDDVRGDAVDLPTAIADHGWPTLGEARGRLMLALLDSGGYRDEYTKGATALEGKLLFVDSGAPTDPFAAMFKDGSPADLTALVDAGFLVTANVDASGETDEANEARLADYVQAGTHGLASDFPAPVEGHDYALHLPEDAVVGCNPRTAPAACTPEEAEAAAVREGL